MVLCPVALAVGCRKCTVFNLCPLKRVIGDYRPDEAVPAARNKPASAGARKKK